MSEILSKTEFVVPIFKADGDPYLEADGDVILVYAKKGHLVSDPDEYPYTHWQIDTGNAGGNGLYKGTIAYAAFEHQGNGIWTKKMATDDLFSDNPNREDNYFVFTGDGTTFPGTGWALVKGYDPRYFGTLNLPPKLVSNLITHKDILSLIDWTNVFEDNGSGVIKVAEDHIEESLITKVSTNTTHSTGNGEDHSSVLTLVNNFTISELLTQIVNDEAILNALANRLYSSTYLAEKVASLT